MSQKRRQYSAQFKSKVALEAIREQFTVAELAVKYQLHPTQINQWKRQALAHMADSFQRGKQIEDKDKSVDNLHRVIGQLTVERDFLARRLNP